jgi:hypothetical protein
MKSRQFRRTENVLDGDSSTWTETPQERADRIIHGKDEKVYPFFLNTTIFHKSNDTVEEEKEEKRQGAQGR